MQQRLLISLAAVTLVVVVVTSLTLGGYRSGRAVNEDIQSLAPTWAEQLPQVGAVKFDSPAGVVNLKLDGDQWRVVERHDYLADNGKVWGMLNQVGEVELLDSKTDNPARHDRLGLRDRSLAGAESMLVTISDATGEVLENFLLGKDRQLGGTGERQYYLRRAAEDQTWVARGEFNPARLPTAWLNRDLIDIAQSRIREVTIQHPDKPLVRVNRQTAEEPFKLQGIPAGRAAKATEVTAIAYGLQQLPLQDVNTIEDADLQWDRAIVVTFTAFDGLQVVVSVQRKDLGIVGRFSANGKGDTSAEADALNTRLSPWVYVIPNHTVSTFTRTLEELLEPQDEKDEGG